jgi:hypothetical protein
MIETWGGKHLKGKVSSDTKRFRRRGGEFGKMGGTSVEWVSMTALVITTQQGSINENWVLFDTNSGNIGVDNRCSACISHIIGYFVGNLVDCERAIKGFSGTRTTGVKMGTLVLIWEDDDWIAHRLLIPNSFYVHQAKLDSWSHSIGPSPCKRVMIESDQDATLMEWNQHFIGMVECLSWKLLWETTITLVNSKWRQDMTSKKHIVSR